MNAWMKLRLTEKRRVPLPNSHGVQRRGQPPNPRTSEVLEYICANPGCTGADVHRGVFGPDGKHNAHQNIIVQLRMKGLIKSVWQGHALRHWVV